MNKTEASNKISKRTAILQKKCPRCRKGNMFKYSFLKKPHKFNSMHENCPHCGQTFYPEPGFYFGAAYISYGVNVGIIVALFITMNILIEKPTLTQLLSGTIIPALLMVPINFRISRSIFLHLFGGIDFQPELYEK